jgi:hypothetical protein
MLVDYRSSIREDYLFVQRTSSPVGRVMVIESSTVALCYMLNGEAVIFAYQVLYFGIWFYSLFGYETIRQPDARRYLG